jgi:hypothetical protein
MQGNDEMITKCLNCNQDYDQETHGAICPHEVGGPNRLPPWPKRQTNAKIVQSPESSVSTQPVEGRASNQEESSAVTEGASQPKQTGLAPCLDLLREARGRLGHTAWPSLAKRIDDFIQTVRVSSLKSTPNDSPEEGCASAEGEKKNRHAEDVLADVVMECADFIRRHYSRLFVAGDEYFRCQDILRNAHVILQLRKSNQLHTVTRIRLINRKIEDKERKVQYPLSEGEQGVPNIDTQRLEPCFCGVAGHFKFQQNGSSCLMCQREWRLMRDSWEAGIKLAHGYGDNFMYLEGEQKERQWQKFLDKAMGVPSPASTPNNSPEEGLSPKS